MGTKSKHSEYKEKMKGREKPKTSSMENSGKFCCKSEQRSGMVGGSQEKFVLFVIKMRLLKYCLLM